MADYKNAKNEKFCIMTNLKKMSHEELLKYLEDNLEIYTFDDYDLDISFWYVDFEELI